MAGTGRISPGPRVFRHHGLAIGFFVFSDFPTFVIDLGKAT